MVLDGPRLAPLSGARPDALVILIHGYGSNGGDMISLATMVQPALPDAVFVAPNAPSRLPRLAAAHQWWPIETFSMPERVAGAAAAAPGLDAFITDEAKAAGLTSDRLLLVGFSQGTMMALHVGLRRQVPVAGIVGFSGMLTAPDQLETDIRSRPPVLLVHGTDDNVVPYRTMDFAATALAAAGVQVATHGSRGVGHSVDQDGLQASIEFARRVLRTGERPL